MLAQMVWGHLFREELSMFKWAYILVFGGSTRLPGWFGALIYCHNSDFANFLKLVPECSVECGWVGQILFGQCPNAERVNLKGSSLSHPPKKLNFKIDLYCLYLYLLLL